MSEASLEVYEEMQRFVLRVQQQTVRLLHGNRAASSASEWLRVRIDNDPQLSSSSAGEHIRFHHIHSDLSGMFVPSVPLESSAAWAKALRSRLRESEATWTKLNELINWHKDGWMKARSPGSSLFVLFAWNLSLVQQFLHCELLRLFRDSGLRLESELAVQTVLSDASRSVKQFNLRSS